ncbi:MAG: hypothetical protein M1829_000341 [Trizodia sp. TS-e1964]|nr:MAG: hypothetical protein M1829_000341 [Trizodia sp. TS-e1964]
MAEEEMMERSFAAEPSSNPPSYYQSHDSRDINLPSVPTGPLEASPELVGQNNEHISFQPLALQNLHISSPRPASIKTLSSPLSTLNLPAMAKPPTGFSENGMMELDGENGNVREGGGETGVGGVGKRWDIRNGSAVSLDDPDVRLAAEALGDLRADFVHSSPKPYAPLAPSSPHTTTSQHHAQQEPLLSLLTSSHPLLSTAIHGSLSAYTSSKSYSPRFKYGAEFVERHIGTPVASTVGSVGRRTGVEGGVRWWLGERRSNSRQSDPKNESGEAATHKRRKVSNESASKEFDGDIERGLPFHPPYTATRRASQASFADSLPAYDDQRSPSYEAQAGPLVAVADKQEAPGWQTRLMISTSGLGAAMSEESLRSLRYCLTWLRWANIHLGKIVVALKNVLEEWDQAEAAVKHMPALAAPADAPTTDPLSTTQESGPNQADPTSLVPTPHQAALTSRITHLQASILSTLRQMVDIVSRYAGSALPENARLLVRRHLTSLPRRFQLAATSNALQPATSEPLGAARRMLVLATEGLDMMAQVSNVLDGTIGSAEGWCERLGRRKRALVEDECEEGDRKWGGEREGVGNAGEKGA